MESGQIGLRQQLQKYLFPSRNANSKSPSQPNTPRTTPKVTMNTAQLPPSEAMTPSTAPWMTPTTQLQQPPTTIPESFSYYMKDETNALSPWGSSSSFQQRPTDPVAQPTMSQDLFPLHMMNSSGHSRDLNVFKVGEVADRWTQKPYEENLDLHVLDPDAPIGQAYTTDETIPILDLRYTSSAQDVDQLNFDSNTTCRRMSGSSLTVSTNGGLSEMPSYEDFSTALSEAPSFNSDYPPSSNRNSMISSTHLSPVPSPRLTPQSRPEQVRAQSRGRALSPRPNMRVAPYSMDTPRSNKRWSTGSYGVIQRRSSPAVYNPYDASATAQRILTQSLPPPPPSGVLPSSLPMNVSNFPPAARPHFMFSGNPAFQRNSMLLPSQLPSQLPPQVPTHFFHHHEGSGFPQPPTLPSHGVLRILQSNGDPHTLMGRYTDLSDPPDLFACLHEEQIPPPPEDMNPSDPDLVPYEQEVRFEGDLYTPRWVRGHGNKREGWCGICKPGRWLVLKNSAYWYDKSFSHGISAATGTPFQEPLDSRRMNGNPDVWEGLCGSCSEWLPLVSSKKKGTTWFRHAYKCHTHPKIKDAPKRRRDNSHSRVGSQVSSMGRKADSQRPITPQMSTPAVSSIETPPNSITCFTTPTSVPTPLRYMDRQPPTQAQQQRRLLSVPPPLRLCSVKSRPTHLLSPVDSYANII